MKSFNIVVCASGGGGNFRSLINHQSSYDYHISLLIVDRECKAINVANENNIPCIVLEKKFLGDSFFEEFAKAIPPDTNLIVLAGFFPIIPQCICDKWERKIINTHPSLLSEYGGKGMYGVKVQEAVLKNREKYAGCTVHYVNAGIDTGEIIFQKRIYVQENEPAWELGGRVFNEEIKLLPLAVKKIREEQLRFALDAVSDMKPSPLVSICCLTYNHAPYLRQCLDGFMMQERTFPIEILIHDDASTDGTQDIIREYEEKFPDIIKPQYQAENQYSKGKMVEAYNYFRAEGRYIALCEGDDYWTDPQKLQKQVDFLESYPDYVMCSHRYRIYFQQEQRMNDEITPIAHLSDGISFDLSFLVRGGWVAHPLSVVFRKSVLDLDAYSKYAMSIDAILFYTLLKKGKGYCMPDVMAVYRVHDTGVWSGLDMNNQRLFSIKARRIIYDIERTDEAALFVLSQFSRPMGRTLILKRCGLFVKLTKILISHFGVCCISRMWFNRLFLNKRLCVNELNQIEDFSKSKKRRR